LVHEANLAKEHWQCSMQNLSTDLLALVTGPDTYRMVKVDDNFAGATVMQTSIDTSKIECDVEPIPGVGTQISTNYTCHCWALDSQQPIVCTDMGDMLLLDFNGAFKAYLPESPRGFQIDSIFPFMRGIIVAGENGWIWTFEQNQSDSHPYKKMHERIGEEESKDASLMLSNITSMAISNAEDCLFFLTLTNQLMKVNIALDGTDPEETNFEYVHEQFHEGPITGMDICMRK